MKNFTHIALGIAFLATSCGALALTPEEALAEYTTVAVLTNAAMFNEAFTFAAKSEQSEVLNRVITNEEPALPTYRRLTPQERTSLAIETLLLKGMDAQADALRRTLDTRMDEPAHATTEEEQLAAAIAESNRLYEEERAGHATPAQEFAPAGRAELTEAEQMAIAIAESEALFEQQNRQRLEREAAERMRTEELERARQTEAQAERESAAARAHVGHAELNEDEQIAAAMAESRRLYEQELIAQARKQFDDMRQHPINEHDLTNLVEQLNGLDSHPDATELLNQIHTLLNQKRTLQEQINAARAKRLHEEELVEAHAHRQDVSAGLTAQEQAAATQNRKQIRALRQQYDHLMLQSIYLLDIGEIVDLRRKLEQHPELKDLTFEVESLERHKQALEEFMRIKDKHGVAIAIEHASQTSSGEYALRELIWPLTMSLVNAPWMAIRENAEFFVELEKNVTDNFAHMVRAFDPKKLADDLAQIRAIIARIAPEAIAPVDPTDKTPVAAPAAPAPAPATQPHGHVLGTGSAANPIAPTRPLAISPQTVASLNDTMLLRVIDGITPVEAQTALFASLDTKTQQRYIRLKRLSAFRK